MSFFKELKRRNVFRVGIAYLVATWLLIQVTDILVPTLDLPEWISKATIFFLVIGFIPALIFAWAFEMTPEGIKREREVDRSESITPVTGRKLNFAIIGLLTAALVYFAWDNFVPTSENTEVAQAPAASQAPDAAQLPEEKSVAVLPFVNMSSDPEQEFFSDGISEEILNALAKVKSLKVAGRTSSFAFKGENQDLRRIGEALGVNHILEGSVRKSGNQVRITAQLIQVDNGFHLWSDTYDRELTNVFAIQDEIANAILQQLKLQLLEGEKSAMVATTTDTRAYEQFLLAKQRIYDRNKLSLEAAARLLDSVIEIDPRYAPAIAQQAIIYLLLVEDQYGDIPRVEADPAAKALLDKALLLDPNHAEAWAGLGLYYLGQPSAHNEAIEALERALSINPNLIDASNWLQIAYGDAGMTGKVLPILEDMLERDPLYRPAIGNATLEFNRLGMQERSLAVLDRARPYIPDDAHLLTYEARTLESLGRYAEALPLAEEAVRRQPSDGIFRNVLAAALFRTHQYERILDPSYNRFWRSFLLSIMDRKEEATILAYELAAEGYPGPLLGIFIRSGKFAEAIKYVEDRWPGLDDLEADFPHGDEGHGMMIGAAILYARTGNDDKFKDAMARVRKAHDQLIGEGVQAMFFFFNEAAYYTLARDFEKALDQLEISIDKGAIGTLKITLGAPAFEPLEGDPRFEALQQRMLDNLNAQRAELGLEPVTI
jgi:TolB-like protein